MGDYTVRCVSCKEVQPRYSLRCPHDDGLLRAYYEQRQLELSDLPGIWKFLCWLPVKGHMNVGGSPVTYKSQGFGREIGLKNLFISFSGYWPKRGALMDTCSFKDLEAAPTMQRLKESNAGTLVVASAGNTARAFAHVASRSGMPLVLFVPQASLHRMWTANEYRGPLCLVGVKGDYNDAIAMAEALSSRPGFTPEGGARNIARRDGMGTVMLEAATQMKALPDHYFQAVGSGTGGIAAWEASMRLMDDGRYGHALPKLHLAQNVPCAPIYSLWTQDPRAAPAPQCPKGMYDDVLFNRKPPWSIAGGVYQALVESNGLVYGVTGDQADGARALFQELEEIDILPAAAVAAAALIQAVDSGRIGLNDTVLLNITGGGASLLRENMTIT